MTYTCAQKRLSLAAVIVYGVSMISHTTAQDTPALPLLRFVCLYTGHTVFCPTASHRMCAGEQKDEADVMHINIFGERKRSL